MSGRFLTMPIHHCRFELNTRFSLQSRWIGVGAKHLFLQIYLFKGLNYVQDKYKQWNQKHMQNSPDWKNKIRRDIYLQNVRIMSSSFRKVQKRRNRDIDQEDPKQYFAWQFHEHVKKGKEKHIKSNDEPLPTYQRHPALSFYIPIRHQVLLPSNIQYIFGQSLGSGVKRSKRIEEMLRFFKLQDQQIATAEKWSFLLQKYICPMDVLQKIDLYATLLRQGTRKLQSFFLFRYPHLEPIVLLKSIMSMNRYFEEPIEPKLQINKAKLTRYFCPHCNVYNCLQHSPCNQAVTKMGSCQPVKESQRFYQTTDYSIGSLIELLSEIKNSYMNRKNKVKNTKNKPCSTSCYRNLSYYDLEARYRQFYICNQPYDQLKVIKRIFGYNPCSIAKVLQTTCDKVLMILILQAPNSLTNFAGISQSDYLKNKDKSRVLPRSGGCSCRKGECSTNKCECFLNKRECSSQTCLCQPVLCGLFVSPQFCRNQNIISGEYPHLKVGLSDKDQNSLGLFTMTAIRAQQVVFWISGKLSIESCWNDFDEWFLNKSGQKTCNIIFGNTNGKSLGGKYRFVCHQNARDANLKQSVRWVNGVEYTVFLAARDLQIEQELFLACNCCLFQ